MAEDLCTQQLGYRTELDAAESSRREMTERRVTSLDRFIARNAIGNDPDHFTYRQPQLDPTHGTLSRMRQQHAVGRLKFLESTGLACLVSPGEWELQRDFDSVLRAMQRTSDRQRILAEHGVVPSDPRLPIHQLNWNEYPDGVKGRILVHGQDESSGRGYLMLESTNALIHYISYTPEMESARSQGGLRTNSFLKLRRLFGIDGKAIVDIHDRGSADALLNKQSYFSDEARRLAQQGITPAEDGWGGWLGKYQAKLHEAAGQVARAKTKERDLKRKREQSLGR
jgi:hypothetical protein